MATAPTLVSIDEYLRSSYHPDVHFVDGNLEDRNVGESSHNRIQGLLYELFVQNRDAWKTDPQMEQRISVTPERVRVCDLCVCNADAPWEEVVTIPPLIYIEVLSPEDRLSRAELVMADYRALGVSNIWLIDPIRRTAYTFGAEGTQIVSGKQLTVPGTQILLDLPELFASLDAAIARRGKA